MELDLRSEEAQTLFQLISQVEDLTYANIRHDVKISMEIIGDRPAGKIATEHPLVQLAIRTIKEQGIHPNLNIGSTDANIPFSQDLPAICLGITSGGGAHTNKEFILTQPVAKGLGQIIDLAENAFLEL